MAQRRQSKTLQQQVKQLVAEGKTEEVYNLLVDRAWLPRGCGYQDHYPTGLRLYAKVDGEQQILVSQGGRFWAWDQPGEQTKEIVAFRQQLEAMEPPEIADAINSFEGTAWWLMHDAADGRIEGDVDSDIRLIRKRVRVAAEIFADKTSLDVEDYKKMQARIKEELAKYEQFLAERWQKLFRVGAVFRITGGGRYLKNLKVLFEVIGAYNAVSVGGCPVIFAREQGTGIFTHFDERDVAELLPVDERPTYSKDTVFLRSPGAGRFPRVWESGNNIREAGSVFQYQGEDKDPRNGVWETFYLFNIADKGDEEVIIARNQDRPQVAEFTASDLPKVSISDRPKRFVVRGENYTEVPGLKLNL